MKPPQENQVICGSNLNVVKSWPSNCIDAICTDPPYGLEFMGKEWDKLTRNLMNPTSEADKVRKAEYGKNYAGRRSNLPDYSSINQSEMQQWHYQWAKAMLRITKPGGFLLCFGGTRTYHRLACALEDAGWEIRDCMMWLYGSGFPKSHNISKAIDKAAGAKRRVVGKSDSSRPNAMQHTNTVGGNPHGNKGEVNLTIPTTLLAQLWDGYGTALKPAWEPIIVAMKPLDGTFAHNAEAHGVVGLNIDATRIGTKGGECRGEKTGDSKKGTSFDVRNWKSEKLHQGRWPANLILDEEAGTMLDEQTGERSSGGSAGMRQRKAVNTWGGVPQNYPQETSLPPSSGGASRYFKQIKGDELCGTILENQKIVGMLNGVIKEIEQSIADAKQYISGLTITANWLKDMKFIIKTLIQQTIELKILLHYLGGNIDFYMDDIERIIKRLMDLSIENVNDVENTNRWKNSTEEVLELIKGIVKIVVEHTCENIRKEELFRFKYCAKTSRKERNMGMEDSSGKKVNDGRQTPIDNPYQRGETIRKNTHPTVKPLALMKYLCTLLKMPSAEQIILDPFLGSGTTGMACRELGINFIGIEKEPEYCEIAVKRIAAVGGIHPVVLHTETPPAEVPKITPCHDEHRQSIINAAVAALRRNQK